MASEVRVEGRAYTTARSLGWFPNDSRLGQGITNSEDGGFLEQSLALQGELGPWVRGWDIQGK